MADSDSPAAEGRDMAPKKVSITYPAMDDVICSAAATVVGTLNPGPSGNVTVTATWTLTSGTGPAPVPASTVTNTSSYSIAFSSLNLGVYSIAVTCPGYQPATVTGVSVANC